ncbi:MAG: UDP-2,3-diacylglucosamine diphosphatase [Deltaproteobacteria bacterium]|nr:UDP-2,3-diacylglucosamine diphosphatase [Candidatus Deferrimicrobium borealis]
MEKGVPISPDRAIFLADAHLNQKDIHTRNFLALADRAAEDKIPLFLLGDVFDLWFGNPGLTFGFQKPVIEHLRRLRREGLRLYYVEGNRDFYLKREHEGTTFDVVSEGSMQAAVGKKRVYLTHGDTVNRADFVYRFWKGISKSRLANEAVAHLPPSVILPMADWIERNFKRSNRRYRGSFPEREARDYSLRLFGEGIDFVILGHFHQERLDRFSREASTKVVAVLPSWKDRWRYFYLTAEGAYGFRAFKAGEPLLPLTAIPTPEPGRS